jgi:DNA replication protein DnaC
MTVLEELIAIIDRILVAGSPTVTEVDRAELLQVLSKAELILQQSPKYIINIQQGGDIKIGDHIYHGADAKTIKEVLREVLQEKQKAKRPKLEEKLLEWVEDDVIKKRLKELRNSGELINLDKEWQPKEVKPSDKRVNLSEAEEEKIKDGSIFNIFKTAPRLLILGEPGAGKTTTMHLLAEALLEQANNDSGSPIPVYLKLSSWERGKKTMFAWLVEALSEKQYRYGLTKKYVESLLIRHRLFLILDELDELEEDCRINCAEALNELLSKGEKFPGITSWSPRQLLVCSRLQEYETLGFKLELNGAIYLKPFSITQIKKYLADREYQNFWQTLQYQDRDQLRDVLERPLFLCIVCDAMKKISIDTLNKLNSWEERQLYLFICYIGWCLQEQDDLEQTENIRLLIWLACQLKEHGQTDFFIESIQPSWLPDGTKKLYFLLVGLSIFLIFIFPPFIACAFMKILDVFWLGGFIIDSLVTALAATFLSPRIKPVEEDIINIIGYSLNLSSFCIRELKARRSLTIAATLFGVSIIVVSILNSIPFTSIKVVCLILLLSSLIWVFARINGREVRQKTISNQGIWNSARNAACVAVFVPIVFAIGLSIFLPAKLLISQFLPGLLMIGLPVGLTCALLCGGLACIQHFILRLILRCHEHPWNYAEFLDNAVKLKLLRRVGGRYEFMHSLLKECFALLG